LSAGIAPAVSHIPVNFSSSMSSLQVHPTCRDFDCGEVRSEHFRRLWTVWPLCYFYGTRTRALVFSTVRLPKFYRAPAALRYVSTRCADAKQRMHCAPSPHTVGARSVPTRAALHRRAGIEPRRHHRLGAHRRSPPARASRTALLARTYPLAAHHNQHPKHRPASPPPPDPRRIAAAAPRSSRRRRHGGHWLLTAILPGPHSVCSHLPLGVNDGSPHMQPACTRLPRRHPRCPRGRRGR